MSEERVGVPEERVREADDQPAEDETSGQTGQAPGKTQAEGDDE